VEGDEEIAKPLPYRIRAELFLQLSRLEGSGIAYDRAIATIGLPAPGAQRLKAMQALAARGVDAAKAGEQSGLFTKLEARLVRAALGAGSPAPIYQRLATYYSARAQQWTAIKARLTMPAFVLGLALFIQPLPGLIGGTLGVAGYAWQVVAPVLAIAAVIALLRLVPATLYRHLPLYGPIVIRSNLRDYFESLALMLEAGVPMLEALPAATDTVSDGDIRRELARVRKKMEQRATFANALGEVSCLRGSRALAFAHTGEESGKLPEMLMRHAEMETADIALFYEQVAAWLPRIVYALVAIKITAGIFSSGGVGPRIPTDL
jgi:type II secretory pathway component PulF